MTLPPEVDHPAQSLPVTWRRGLVLSVSLGGVLLALPLQPLFSLPTAVLVIQLLAAIVLMSMPGLGHGRLSFRHQAWFWESARLGCVRVHVMPVLDVGGLLCLRLSPTSSHAGGAWTWPAWVWLSEADPKAWMDLRLTLHCLDVKDGRWT